MKRQISTTRHQLHQCCQKHGWCQWYDIAHRAYDIAVIKRYAVKTNSEVGKLLGPNLLVPVSWGCHQMETFSSLRAICAGNSPVSGEFPAQRPVTRSFDIFFDLRLNKRLSKQSWGWWFETLSCPLWRQCNVQGPSIAVTPYAGCMRCDLKYREPFL